MKNIGKNLLLVVLLFGTMSMKANTVSENSEITSSITIIRYVDVKEGYKVIIKDNYGIVLYDESIQIDGQYIKGFDLTTLPEGNYYFELDKGLEIQIKPFKVNEGNVKFLRNENYSFFKPVVRKKDGLVFVSQLIHDSEDVRIKILDSSNGLLHSESVDGESTTELRKIFDFSELPINDYRIVIKTNNREFTNSITL